MSDCISIDRRVAQQIVNALTAALGQTSGQTQYREKASAANSEEAAGWKIPFGKHKGETLGQIASDDEGREYLQWLLDKTDLYAGTRSKIEAVMGSPPLADELPDADCGDDGVPF